MTAIPFWYAVLLSIVWAFTAAWIVALLCLAAAELAKRGRA